MGEAILDCWNERETAHAVLFTPWAGDARSVWIPKWAIRTRPDGLLEIDRRVAEEKGLVSPTPTQEPARGR